MNQNPEQIARDTIDGDLLRCGWVIQGKNQINLKAAIGVAVREYQTDIRNADYALFAASKLLGFLNCRIRKGAMVTAAFLIAKISNFQ